MYVMVISADEGGAAAALPLGVLHAVGGEVVSSVAEVRAAADRAVARGESEPVLLVSTEHPAYAQYAEFERIQREFHEERRAARRQREAHAAGADALVREIAALEEQLREPRAAARAATWERVRHKLRTGELCVSPRAAGAAPSAAAAERGRGTVPAAAGEAAERMRGEQLRVDALERRARALSAGARGAAPPQPMLGKPPGPGLGGRGGLLVVVGEQAPRRRL
eukprot:TRINITY_DN37314_c0_g1_i1.p2 TRINITY_DN37314_c0_g1~~TRINITY_DN37314_c0_g1_i1.p2  ORF type:complete len:224 (+),score=68.70 TRINITY_DN37314_c0_g1_i1:178-849(+)